MKQRYKNLILPTFVLCILTAYSGYALLSNKNTVFIVQSHRIVSTEILQKKRGPASTQNQQTFNFDCHKETQSAKVDSPQIFIKFENCLNLSTESQIRMLNETNQYIAQIFRHDEKLIATDYIQLSKGENILKFEISLNGKQKKTQIIKIDRQNSEIQ
jgi:hypothetical protein